MFFKFISKGEKFNISKNNYKLILFLKEENDSSIRNYGYAQNKLFLLWNCEETEENIVHLIK